MRMQGLIAMLVFGVGVSACGVDLDDGYRHDVVRAGNADADFRSCAASFGLRVFSIEDRYGYNDAAIVCIDDADCFDVADQTYEFYPDAPRYYDNPIITPAYRLDPGRLSDLRDLTLCHQDSYGF